MDSGLDEDETELGIAVLTVALQVLADGNSLLDHVVQILRNVGSIACTKRRDAHHNYSGMTRGVSENIV